jgi:hypothetical protein
VLNGTLCLTGVLRHAVLVKFEGLFLKPEILVTERKTRDFIYTLSMGREQRKRLYRMAYMAVAALVVLPFEPGARLSLKT